MINLRSVAALLAAALGLGALPAPALAGTSAVSPTAARAINMPPPPWCPGGGSLVGPSSAPAKGRAVAHMDGMRALQISQSGGAAQSSRFVSFCSQRGVSIIGLRTQYLAFDGKNHVVLTLSNPKSPAIQEIIVMQDANAVSGIPLPRNMRVTASYRPPR